MILQPHALPLLRCIYNCMHIRISGCVAQYFGGSEASEAESDEVSDKKLLGYKCVLSSKATEETMVYIYV